MTEHDASPDRSDSADPPALHRARRIDLAISRWRAKRALDKGYVVEIVPFISYGSTGWLRVLCRATLTKPGRPIATEPEGLRGWRNFTSVPVENAEVSVDVGGSTRLVTADPSGIVDSVIPVDLEPGWRTLTLTCDGGRPVQAHAYVVDPDARFGLVSDIDDTVMVTVLPRPLLAAWHSFVLNEHARATTPGMPVLYERIVKANPGTPVVYLSTGAWNVAPALTRFLSRNLYPIGSLLLTDWGPTADRWFRSGQEHKRHSLARLAQEFPDVKWLLVGDDGQHDESIYADFANAHPDRVAAICIRQLSPSEAVLAGSALRDHPVASNSPVPWIYAGNGAEMAEELEKLGIVEPERTQPEVPG